MAKRKGISLIACVLFCLTIVFSIAFLAAESRHVCTGEECAVCAELQTCISILRTLSGTALATATALCLQRCAAEEVQPITRNRQTYSLVLLKVKLTA